MTPKPEIRIETAENQIASLVMADRRHANAWDRTFTDCLEEKLIALGNLQPKVLILRGLPEIFSAGASRQALLDLCDGRLSACAVRLPERLIDLPFPVIAAMEGHAIGGGLVMGMCCDLIVMANESRYGAPFMTYGVTPGLGCTALLPEMVGPYLAAEMMFTGRNYRGSELAGHATNINYIVNRSEVVAKAWDLALQIADKSLETLAMLKLTLSQRKKRLIGQARAQEHLMHQVCFSSPLTRKTIEENYPE